MTPHPSQWGHRRWKNVTQNHPHQNVKKVALQTVVCRGSSTTKLVGWGRRPPCVGVV